MNEQRLNHLGYRPWSGRRTPGWTRFAVITSVGFLRAWQSSWVRRMLLLAWLPTIWFGVGFFMWEQAVQYPEWRQSFRPFLRSLPRTAEFDQIRASMRTENLGDARHSVWAGMLQAFFRYPQGVLMVMMIGLISPPLISQDIRSRAFLLYFSRPLTRGEYLLGKLANLWIYLAMVSTIPALVLYLLGVLLSPHFNVVWETWDIPLRILAASVVLMGPTSILALCLSSLTQESRYAGFAWFAIWILGWFTYASVRSAQMVHAGSEDEWMQMAKDSPWTHLSLYHTLGRVQRWVFGFSDWSDAAWSMVVLLVVTTISLAVLLRRISAPMRV